MFLKYLKHWVIAVLLMVLFGLGWYYNIINLNQFFTAQDTALHFNILTISSVIVGFLFTGLSILIGVAEKEIIKKFNDANMMSSIYSTIILGIIVMSFSILISLLNIIFKITKFIDYIIIAELYTLVLGFIYFLLSIYDLKFIVKNIRESYQEISPEAIKNYTSHYSSKPKKNTIKK